MDEKELLRAQIQSYEYYAGLIDRAVGGTSRPVMPRWDEQRAAEYRAIADQLRRRLAELEAREREQASAPTAAQPPAAAPASGDGAPIGSETLPAGTTVPAAVEAPPAAVAPGNEPESTSQDH